MHVVKRALARAVSEGLRAFSHFERRRRDAVDLAARISPPPILIVGAPRSGSTLLYQLLTNSFEIGYQSNLMCMFFRTPSLGLDAHERLFGQSAFNVFQSSHGRTVSLREPSECGKFWYQWFPRDRHFVDAGETSEAALREIRATFAMIARQSGRPFLMKNLNCGQRLRPLSEALPELIPIFVRRDPVETAVSILRARVKAHGHKETWWSVRPRDYEDLRGLPYPQQVARQVYLLERQILADFDRFPRSQRLVVDYPRLCSDPGETLDRFEALMRANGASLARRAESVIPALRQRTPDESGDVELIRQAVRELDWN